MRLGSQDWADIVYSNSAVIYADGATAGNPAVVAHLLRVRRAEATDIAQVLPLLAKAEADPRLTQNLPALMQEFTNRAGSYAAAMRDNVTHHNADRVCLSVARTLSYETRRESPQQAVDALRIMLTRWLNQLNASKPSGPVRATP